MSEYICYSSKGDTERALYYTRKQGRRKMYRNTYPTPKTETLILLTYKTEQAAQQACKEINEMFNDDFIARLATDEEIAAIKENIKNLKKGNV